MIMKKVSLLPKAPNIYSPLVDEAKSKERRDLVLNMMHKRGYLSAEETVRLQGKTLGMNVASLPSELDAYLTYIDMVLNEAEEKYQLTNEEVLTGGYTIVVPMDQHLQEKSYEKLQDSTYFPEQNEDAESYQSH